MIAVNLADSFICRAEGRSGMRAEGSGHIVNITRNDCRTPMGIVRRACGTVPKAGSTDHALARYRICQPSRRVNPSARARSNADVIRRSAPTFSAVLQPMGRG